MKLKRIVVCLGVLGFLGTPAAVRAEEQIIKLRIDPATQECHKEQRFTPGGGMSPPQMYMVTVCNASATATHDVPPYTARSDHEFPAQTLIDLENQRNNWVSENSFLVYTKEEVYHKSTIDTKVDEIYAEITAKLAALEVSMEDKEEILTSVKESMQPTIETLRRSLTEEITQSIRDELKAAGVLE